MAQHDYDIANQSGANFRADLNNALDAIVSNNSGSSEPSTTFAYEWWIDTSANVLKLRNSANNAWITLPLSITADNSTSGALTVNGNLSTTGTLDVNGGELILDADADTSITADSDDQIDFRVGAVDVMTLTNSHLVLKGTTPKITIGDGGEEDTALIFDGNAQDFYIGLDDTDDFLKIGTGSTIGTNTLVTIENGGNVGIGCDPVGTFQIKTQTNGNAAFQNSTSVTGGVKINCFNDAANASSPFEIDGSSLQFNIASTEKMRLDSSGRLGLGRTTPQAPMEVNQVNTECSHFGSASTNSSNNFTGISLGFAEAGNLNSRKVKIVSTGIGDGAARQNLDFLVDTNTDSNSAVLVDSKLNISGTTGVVSGDLNDTSDIGFKENITDVTESLSLIKQLQPRFFTWKDSKASRGESTGFIAQEVEKIIPLLVQGNDLGSITTADDGSELEDMSGKSINTIGLVAYLTKAIQELEERVKTLED